MTPIQTPTGETPDFRLSRHANPFTLRRSSCQPASCYGDDELQDGTQAVCLRLESMSSPSSAESASPEADHIAVDGPNGVIHDTTTEERNTGLGTGTEGQSPLGNEESTLEGSFFPAPSHYYKRYTAANLSLPLDHPDPIQPTPGSSETVPFFRSDLEPPRVDWIQENGSYTVFGQTWPVEEQLPSLSETGVREMFDPSQSRVASLQTLLKALLLSYTSLVSSLLVPPPSLAAQITSNPDVQAEHHHHHPPPPQSQQKTDPERLVEHIRVIAINMHHLVNELRPVQARETLKNMMKAQISTRRAKTVAIREKCAELSATLEKLKYDLSQFDTPVTSNDNNRLEVDEKSSEQIDEGALEEHKRIQQKLREEVDNLMRTDDSASSS